MCQMAWRKLEKADTDDTVDLMVQVCSMGAGGVMVTILQKMKHNQLAMDLERDLGRLGGQSCNPWQGGGGGGVNVNVASHSGGMVNAPSMSGCTINGPLTFSYGGVPNAQQGGGQEFFKKHKGELEMRLGVLAPLLIDLERCRVLSRLEREQVQSKSTHQEQNHVLITMLEKKGAGTQDKFYEALKSHDPLLVEDLQRSATSPEVPEPQQEGGT
ncbi:caspase recruitment domain-containing protein 8-like isoform X3 [Alosa pseudoharengus]|uniref:caspase recruitment domain-containing protein 8-like isoform X3 n=1 Tax=Alosa pseudoharengus TaxID=34774 RepID=UPI003F8A35B1